MKATSKKLPYKEWLQIFSKVPRICVDLIVKSDKGIILTKRDIYPYKGSWHTPGGGILFSEKVKDAVNRVAKDELGIKVKFEKVIGIMEFRTIKNYGHTISVGCLCKPITNSLSGSDQAKEIKYFKVAPKNTIKEQKEFLIEHKFLKNV